MNLSLKASFHPQLHPVMCSQNLAQNFRWRCVQGKHPSTSRTRWLRPVRPRVLHWRRCGRLGGCRIKFHRVTSVITYLDNFTLIKIIKETYVDLIVTDIRFYRMKDFERNDSFDVNKPIQATKQVLEIRFEFKLV